MNDMTQTSNHLDMSKIAGGCVADGNHPVLS
jgi:hypothetical protein